MAHPRASYRNVRGSTKRVGITVRDVDGALQAATTLTAEVLDPTDPDDPTTYTQGVDGTWTNPSTGQYYFFFTPDAGHDRPWEVRVAATDATGNTLVSIVEIQVMEDRFED